MAYMQLLNHLCNKYNIDGYSERDGDNDGEVFVFSDSWDNIRKLNNILKAQFYMLGIDTSEVNERDDTGYIDFATDDNWATFDDGFICDNCYKFYRNSDYYQNYVIFESVSNGICCVDCVKNDDSLKSDYINTLINNSDNANTILDDSELEDAGFEDYGAEYANGWYGRRDSPQQILKDILDKHPEAEVVFSVRKTYNYWETRFKVYVRNITEDEDIEDDDSEDNF